MFNVNIILPNDFQYRLFFTIIVFLIQYIFFHTGQQDETLCKNYISEVKDLRLRIEDCEAQTVARIRKPVEKEPLKECVQKRTEQQVNFNVNLLSKDG